MTYKLYLNITLLQLFCYAAAWKVIKGWLPAAGVKKIKFVSKSNVGEFVREEDRLKEWGGEFVYENRFDPGPEISEINGNIDDTKSIVSAISSPASAAGPATGLDNAGGLLKLDPSANDVVFDRNGYGDLVARYIRHIHTVMVWEKGFLSSCNSHWDPNN